MAENQIELLNINKRNIDKIIQLANASNTELDALTVIQVKKAIRLLARVLVKIYSESDE